MRDTMARTPEEQKEANRLRARKRAKKGLCCSCNRKAINGTRRCEVHTKESSAQAAKRYQGRKAVQICPQCRNPERPIVEGKTCCQDCLDYHAANSAQTRKQPGYKEARQAYVQEHYEEWRAAKLCVLCGKEPALPDRVRGAICTAQQKQRSSKLAKKRRRAVITHYGGACACCGQDIFEFLEIDHIDGGGAAHRKKIGQGGLYRWLITNDYPSGFQVLCSDCNHSKGRYGACPHRSRGLPTVAALRELLHTAGWFVNHFWEETDDPTHRAQAMEIMGEIEKATGKRI
jgi:hypothetical protein